jgi:hypothetical protein
MNKLVEAAAMIAETTVSRQGAIMNMTEAEQNHIWNAAKRSGLADVQITKYRVFLLAFFEAALEDETSVKAVAKIICDEEYGDPDGFGAITLGNVERTTPRWKYCEGSARAVLDALLSRAKEQQA